MIRTTCTSCGLLLIAADLEDLEDLLTCRHCGPSTYCLECLEIHARTHGVDVLEVVEIGE